MLIYDVGIHICRLVFSYGKEDILGRHDAPVRCVEYSYAAGFLKYYLNANIQVLALFDAST